MTSVLLLDGFLWTGVAHAAGGAGEGRTWAAQAGIAALLFLEVITLHLSGWRFLTGGRRGFLAALFTMALCAQYAFASFVTASAASLLLVPAVTVLLALTLLPFLYFGARFPRRWHTSVGLFLVAFLLVLTFHIRGETGSGFEWARVRDEISFISDYNWPRGIARWFVGFFQDDFMRLFWWTLALFLVAGTFLVLAFAGPREAPRPPPKQLPLYAPRRGARRKRR
jgi:hypothetical protein